ncbi:MAG: Ig-like domain-containing domain, partial [Planctomycetota bacterium]
MKRTLPISISILSCIVLAFGAGCYESGDYPADFKVINCYPAAGQTNVALNADVVIRFSTPPDYQTIQGTKQVILVDNSNSVVPTTFAFQGELLTVTPISPLGTGQTYGVAVRPGVQDIFGANISVPFSATFSTGAQVTTIPNFPPFQIPPPPGPPPGGTPGTYSQTGPMVFARAHHAMTRLVDGRVLATGGENIGPLG